MNRDDIIEEIRRTAAENGGKPLGSTRFQAETGIKQYQWGKYWGTKWSDALQAAGFAPNEFVMAFDTSHILDCYAELAIEVNRLPGRGDLLIKYTATKNYPNPTVFQRLGNKATFMRMFLEHCKTKDRYAHLVPLCEEYLAKSKPRKPAGCVAEPEYGFVYLMKSGRYYKLGKTNAVGRREREHAIQLPEKIKTIHEIRTDDPSGIEAYWHKRFEAKRQGGEWFDLDASDIAAFKRRKFM